MICPYCQNDDLKVLDSRPGLDGESIRRRRECAGCGRRFTTWERFELPRLYVIKRDGTRADFLREKVLDSMRVACRKRPVSIEAIDQAAARIEDSLRRLGVDEISSREVGNAVMRELSSIDTVAYVRFASVYQEFETVKDFADLVEDVQREEALSPFRNVRAGLLKLETQEEQNR